MRKACTIALALSLSLALMAPGQACTTFLLSQDGARVVGKSYDYPKGMGMVFHNKRQVAKRALAIQPGQKPLEWVSRYSSLTFNQYGREFPCGGMNEAGLVVEIMWLDSTVYPQQDDRPVINELQWIQSHLDRHATVREMALAAPGWTVSPAYAKVHYLACDKGGECGTFEYIQGKLVIHRGQDLVAPALTNNTYQESVAFLRNHQGFGGKRPMPQGLESLSRFARVASLIRERTEGDLTARAFALLDRVSMGDYSKWNIVYDPLNLRVAWRSNSHPAIKRVDLARLDPSCSKPVRALDINVPGEGDALARFQDYTREANVSLVASAIRDIADKLPPQALNLITAYPEMCPCQEGK